MDKHIGKKRKNEMNEQELIEYKSKIIGYLVSCRAIPEGRYYKNHDHAEFEMHRQARLYGSSGIREVFDQEWNQAIQHNWVYTIVNKRNKKVKAWEL